MCMTLLDQQALRRDLRKHDRLHMVRDRACKRGDLEATERAVNAICSNEYRIVGRLGVVIDYASSQRPTTKVWTK
jgi:hypothetical protein